MKNVWKLKQVLDLNVNFFLSRMWKPTRFTETQGRETCYIERIKVGWVWKMFQKWEETWSPRENTLKVWMCTWIQTMTI